MIQQKQQNGKQENQPSEKERALELQVTMLQDQLKQLSTDAKALDLQKRAEEMKKHRAELEGEADVRKTLSDVFSPSKTGIKPGEELEQQQLVTILADAVGMASEAQEKLILSKVTELMDSLNERIEGAQKAVLGLAAGISINQAASTYPDFNMLKPEIAKILSETSGLSPEDAYLLYKARVTKGQSTRTESERPGEIPAAGSSRSQYVEKGEGEETAHRSPRQVFLEKASDAVDKILAARRGS